MWRGGWGGEVLIWRIIEATIPRYMSDSGSTETGQEILKQKVHDHWNEASCGTEHAVSGKFTREYFDEIEAVRYNMEPEIFSFAQFTRHHGEKILEVGVGAGTDFLQWVRAGCRAYGIDLTEEAIENVRHRLEVYGFTAEEIRTADCENLPYEDNTFDLVYSWGVIHHTPDTEKALREIIRVCRPGGTCKVMVYHRRSLEAFYVWVRHALLKFRPWKSFAWCIYQYMESPGTKAYTPGEIRLVLKSEPVENIKVKTHLTCHDLLLHRGPFARFIANILANLFGRDRVGWFLMVECRKM
jgi:ubiquinone/menaquinone biosynthesis C-methylase UbiE